MIDMSLPTQPYKGARDFYPEDKRLQKYLFGVYRQVAERFGYEEYDAPILEPVELYKAKSGEEIVNEQTYVFKDRGDRTVVIRPEMTPSVSRMVAAKRQELAYPLRWYSIPNLWRYERPQRGRLREHWQLNVDIFGVAGLEAEHEVIEVADGILQAFGAKRDMYQINLNSRKLTDAIMNDYLGLNTEQAHATIKLVDRMHKMELAAFKEQLKAILGSDGAATTTKLLDLLKTNDPQQLPAELANHPSVTELKTLMELLGNSGITNLDFDVTLMRGFDYYTDIVFEMTDSDASNNRSMFGGGRYDGLVALFGVEPVPTVGFGMGDVTLQNFLETHKLLPKLKPEINMYVALVGNVYEPAQTVISQLRQAGLNLAVDISGRKADKQTRAAAKKGLQHVLFIGAEELASGQFTLKDLTTGQEAKLSLEELIAKAK